MKVLPVLVYLFLGLFLVVTYLPEVELRRSKGKQVKNSGTQELRQDKRTREIISDGNAKQGGTQKSKKGKGKMNNDEDDVNGGNSNAGSVKKLRGSKRQKKKEKKKHKSREKAERNTFSSPDGDVHVEASDHSKQATPDRRRPDDHGQADDTVQWSGILGKGIQVLSSLVSEDDSKGAFRSDKLRCSDRLNAQLVKFYEEDVRLHPKDVEVSRSIVNQFMKQLWPYIMANTEGLNFSTYQLVGSMSEDLAAVIVSDFDHHLHLHFESLEAEEIAGISGYSHIVCDHCGQYVEAHQGQSLLSPSRIISKLQSIVQKAVDSGKVSLIGDCYQYRPGYKGPTVAIELDCSVDGDQETLRIELVPLIMTVDGQQFVAKKAAFGVAKNAPLSWRRSYREQEAAFISRLSTDDLSLLRLAKAIFLHKEKSLNYLSSYQLKNVYCHLHRSDYNWQSKRLCDQLMDFIDRMWMFAKQKNLPCCFDDDINLFSSLPSPDTIRNMENRLKKTLDEFEDVVRRWIDIPELKDEL